MLVLFTTFFETDFQVRLKEENEINCFLYD